MSDVRITSSLFSFIIDFQVYPVNQTDFLTLLAVVSGTPSNVSDEMRLTSAAVRSRGQYLFGETVFRLSVPSPAVGSSKAWGLEGIATEDRGALRFNIDGERFFVSVYDNANTLIREETIPWNPLWSGDYVDYRISWSESGAMFSVALDGAVTAVANISFSPRMVNLPLFFFIRNGNADNVNVPYIALNNVGRVQSPSSASGGDTSQPATVDQGTSPWVSALVPSASTAGTAIFRNAALTNTAVVVKASAGNLYGYNLYNPGTALAYIHFYNVAQASVTVGTTVPDMSIALPSTATATIGVDGTFGANPINFGTAITIAASTTPGGGIAPGTALVCNLLYK